MTRLKEDDIGPIARQLNDYDARLKRMTDASLRQIACRAAGVDEALRLDVLDRVRFAAVPVTSGLGVIGGFSGTVAAIVSHLGFEAFVTESCDVAGIAEGVERGADVLMLADDDRFVAITPRRKHVVDNSRATAEGFVAALELMKGGLAGESVLVLGCGPLGVAATKALIDRGASVSLCDIEQERALAVLREIGQDVSDKIRMEDNPHTALNRYELIFDATNVGNFIEAAHLTPATMVAAPGMPCALTPEAMAENRDRILHDALEIGTATMAVQAAVTLAIGAEAKKADKI
ncbi:MAG: 3-methylornithyl-N6-L-lysine dehydrogenase PylD, partial [Longimicrobiales bacterium]|nr:3-methylornithyl-N6-L-lysine dehydrogenase PylD [Longimicrobiales bacterium]